MTEQTIIDEMNDPLFNAVFNEGLEYAAAWLENNIRSDAPEVAEFARNMAASLRAAKKPEDFQQSFIDAVRNDVHMRPEMKRYYLTMAGVRIEPNRFRRKSREIEATQFYYDQQEIAGVVYPPKTEDGKTYIGDAYVVNRHQQHLFLLNGDWVISQGNGHYYSMPDAVFRATFEPVTG